MLLVVARARQRRKLLRFSVRLISVMTAASSSPLTSRISSKVIRSAQAAQITQSSVPTGGTGLTVRVLGQTSDLDTDTSTGLSKATLVCCQRSLASTLRLAPSLRAG